MDQLVSRLANLSYEIFGLFIPGAVAFLFLITWWGALGNLAPLWTGGAVAKLTFLAIEGWIRSLDSSLGIGIGIPAVAVSYFMGHFLLWSSRVAYSGSGAKGLSRWWKTMTFRIQRPTGSYNSKLEPLLKKVLERFSAPELPALEWRQAYPIIKAYLMERRQLSLLSTYQNKYTLHRSITFAAVALVWLCFIAVLGALLTTCLIGLNSDVRPLLLLLAFGVLVASAFSSSYRYYWQMWGDTLITESYSQLFGPDDRNARSA